MKRAFTLIELLVVIAIIAILAAILFPVFAQAKLAAKKASSISNVKQLGTSTFIYLSDTDDVMPIGQEVLPSGATFVNGNNWSQSDETLTTPSPVTRAMWANALVPYIKNRDIWKTPVGTDYLVFAGETEAQLGTQRYGYSYNGYLNVLSSTAIEQAAATTLYTENPKSRQFRKYFFTWPWPNGTGVPNLFNKDSGSISVWTLQIDSTWYNYSQNHTVAYADGHARALNAKGRDSYWTATAATGIPTFATGPGPAPGINIEAYAIGGFWFRPAAPCAKS